MSTGPFLPPLPATEDQLAQLRLARYHGLIGDIAKGLTQGEAALLISIAAGKTKK